MHVVDYMVPVVELQVDLEVQDLLVLLLVMHQ